MRSIYRLYDLFFESSKHGGFPERWLWSFVLIGTDFGVVLREQIRSWGRCQSG